MNFQETNEDLRDLGYVLETTSGNGSPRIAPRVREHLMRAVTGRTRLLPGLARQAVRLAVALDKASATDWIITLHSSTDLLRRSRFFSFFQSNSGPGITWSGDHTLQLQGPGLDGIDGEPFILDLRRAPMLGGYLDLAAYMLGFDVLTDIIADAVQDDDAEKAAKTLHDAVLAWLHPRLRREHLERQSSAIRSFFIESGVTTHLDVDDETVLSFWERYGASEDGIDGFRLWTNAVTQLMAYRRALSEAADARGIDAPISLDFEDDLTGSTLVDRLEDGDVHLDPLDWISPLTELVQKQDDTDEDNNLVKWFASKDAYTLIRTFLTDRRLSGDDEAMVGMNAFADGRPDTNLVLTWLRYVAFGARQRSLVQHARTPKKGANIAENYDDIAVRLESQADGIFKTYLAATWALLNAEPKIGFMNFLLLDRETASTALTETLGKRNVQDCSPQDRFVILEVACRMIIESNVKSVKECRSVFQKTNRSGFRENDMHNEALIEELARGTLILPRLRDDVKSMADKCASIVSDIAFIEDNDRFEDMFQALYPAPA